MSRLDGISDYLLSQRHHSATTASPQRQPPRSTIQQRTAAALSTVHRPLPTSNAPTPHSVAPVPPRLRISVHPAPRHIPQPHSQPPRRHQLGTGLTLSPPLLLHAHRPGVRPPRLVNMHIGRLSHRSHLHPPYHLHHRTTLLPCRLPCPLLPLRGTTSFADPSRRLPHLRPSSSPSPTLPSYPPLPSSFPSPSVYHLPRRSLFRLLCPSAGDSDHPSPSALLPLHLLRCHPRCVLLSPVPPLLRGLHRVPHPLPLHPPPLPPPSPLR